MSKTGDIYGTYGAGSKPVNITGKVKGYIQIGLDEKAVNDYLNQQTERLTQKLKTQGQTVTDEVVKQLSTLVGSKFEEFIYNIHAEQADSEERVREAVQKRFKELRDGNVVLFKNFSEALYEKLAEGNELLQSIIKLQDKAVYYAEERYNALYSLLDDNRKRVEHINDREARKDLENISSLQKKLEYGHSALKSAEFERAKKHFEVVTASNLGGSDLALVANAYFGIALAEWQIQMIWDDVRNSEQFILYKYDIDLSDKHGSYREAIKNATPEQADVFGKFVDKLKRAKKKLCDYLDNGLSYDCFICTKVTESKNGEKTEDYKWIKEEKLYEVLTQNGSKPFYSEEDCKKYAIKKGTLEYESLIYYALSRAKVMLLVCSQQDYLETPWVANEINRFRQFCKKRGENPLERIIVVHEDAAVELQSDLDEKYQGCNRNKMTVEEIAEVVKVAVKNASRYVERGWMYCPICGKKYSSTAVVCNDKNEPCVGTRLVDELTWANILRNREREEYEREIEKLRRENEAISKSKQDAFSTQDIALGLEGVKFGLSCGTGNPKSAKICMEGGGTTFAQTRVDDVRKAEETGRVAQRLKRREDKKDRKALLLKLKKEAEIRRAEKLKGKPWLASDYPTVENYDKCEFGIEGTELKKYLKKDFSGKVKIPWGVTTIGQGAFDGCGGLTSITIPNSVTLIEELAFYGCMGLTSITIPNSVTSIGYGAFSLCSNLTSITIPNSVTLIEEFAFSGCVGLTSIIIPNSVTSIGMGAFDGCGGLTSITIPNSVTLIEELAFYGCMGLTSIIIPDSVTTIRMDAFRGCDLTTIYCEAKEQPSGWDKDWNPDNRPVIWGYKKQK